MSDQEQYLTDFDLRCSCGARWDGQLVVAIHQALAIKREFLNAHAGEGHDAKTTVEVHA